MPDPAAIELADLADDVLREVIELRQLYEELERLLGSIEAAQPSAEAPIDADDEGSVAGPALMTQSGPELGGVRRIATTAALSGATRDEVEAYLRDELGLQDSSAALDEVFGEVPQTENRKR